jgi:hypothetical protein
MLTTTSYSQELSPRSLVDLLGQDLDVRQRGVDKAIIEFNGVDLMLHRDPSGWLRAQIELDTALQNTGNGALDSQLLRVQTSLDSPVRFAKVAAKRHAATLFVINEACLKRRVRQGTFEAPFQELKCGLMEGLRVTENLGAKSEADRFPQDSSREEIPKGDLIPLDKADEEIESHLKENSWDWSRGAGLASFRINLDLEEYLQRIAISPEDAGRIVFRSPIVELTDLPECCERAISDFLLRANAALKLARASIVTEQRNIGLNEESRSASSRATVVLEVVLPFRLWTAFTLEQILSSLIVGARATRLETEVLFDPGAARLYLDILEKEKQEHGNRKSRHKQAAR